MADNRTFNARDSKFYASSRRHAILEASYTRPATTTQYTAGDVVAGGTPASTPLEFSSAVVANGLGGKIVQSLITTSANQGTAPNFQLYLFGASPTIVADNAPLDIADASTNKLLPGGLLQFNSWQIAGTTAGTAGNMFCVGSALGGAQATIPYQCATTSSSFFGVLVAKNTYVPVASEVITVRLGVEMD